METTGTFLAILTPLVVVPLTVITFYLRSLREQQFSWQTDFTRRVENVEKSATDLRKALGNLERDYTTKEEWLRECMHARRTLELLSEMTVRMETTLRTILPTMDVEQRGGHTTTGSQPTDPERPRSHMRSREDGT